MARTDARQGNTQGPDPAHPDAGYAGDPLLSTRRGEDSEGVDSPIQADALEPTGTSGSELSQPPDSQPTEASRSAMFSVLVIVMASAPTYVALRAIRASRSADFPLGDSLGNTAVVLFAVVAIALLSVCFWPSMSTATWGAPTMGTMLGASGVVMACIGATHAVAGIIGTGFLSEPAWLAWIVLIGVYPLAGQVSSRLARDYVGEGADVRKGDGLTAKKQRPSRDKDGRQADPADPESDDHGDTDGGYVGQRSFGSRGDRAQEVGGDTSDWGPDQDDRYPDEPRGRRPSDRDSRNVDRNDDRYNDDRDNRDQYGDDQYRDSQYSDDRYRDDQHGDDRNGASSHRRQYDDGRVERGSRDRPGRRDSGPLRSDPAEFDDEPDRYGADAYANDPFADPSDFGDDDYSDDGYSDDAHDGHAEWDDDEEWDDDPFADYDD